MNKQTIEIEVPDGKKAVWKDGRLVFEDIEPQLPNTWREFCKNYPIKRGEFLIDTSSQIVAPAWATREVYATQNVLPSYKAAEAHLACMQLHQLRNAWREGWEPDWKDNTQAKFAIIYNKDEHIVFDSRFISRFLSFQDETRAKEFLECYKGLIKKAGDLI